MCCVCVQTAPGGDLGCRVYVAGGTLVRREKKNLDHAIRLCLCMIRMLDGSFRLYIHVFSMY